MQTRKPFRRRGGAGLAGLAALLLAACGSVPKPPAPVAGDKRTPPPAPATAEAPRPSRELPTLPPAGSGRGGYYQDDGPGENPPDGLHDVPDAEPKVEPALPRANRPYTVFGKTYTPIADDRPFRQRGVGSWYGRKFHGQKTSSGEPYDMYKMTAAHPTLPIPSYARVTNVNTGAQVIVRINDRGPFHAGRIIDLSYTAALKLGYLGKGSGQLEVERLLPDEIARIAAARRAGGTRMADGAAREDGGNAPTRPAASHAPATPAGQAIAGATLPTMAAGGVAAAIRPAGEAAPPAAGQAVVLLPVSAPESPDVRAEALAPGRSVQATVPRTVVGAGEGGTGEDGTDDPLGLALASTLASVPQDAGQARAAAPREDAAAAAGFYLQFGAFSQASNAHAVRGEMQKKWLAQLPPLEVVASGVLFRLFSGPFATRGDALAAAQRLQDAGLSKPVVVQR